MKISSVSERLIEKTKLDEKFVPKPYRCPAGVWSIGFGTTYFPDGTRVTENSSKIDKVQANYYLRTHYRKVSIFVDLLCRDDLNQNQFDAIADFVYNAGTTYTDKKTGVKRIYNLFANVNKRMPNPQLREYIEKLAVTGNGVRLNGLVKRRKEMADLFFK